MGVRKSLKRYPRESDDWEIRFFGRVILAFPPAVGVAAVLGLAIGVGIVYPQELINLGRGVANRLFAEFGKLREDLKKDGSPKTDENDIKIARAPTSTPIGDKPATGPTPEPDKSIANGKSEKKAPSPKIAPRPVGETNPKAVDQPEGTRTPLPTGERSALGNPPLEPVRCEADAEKLADKRLPLRDGPCATSESSLSLSGGTKGLVLTGRYVQCDENGIKRPWHELVYMEQTKWVAYYYLRCSR